MENFVVSARKYRPKRFDEVIGQDAITTTLQNAINDNHLAQALLFCGPRGVGKTTCARIVARLINEVDGDGNENSLNIFELDAASNNSVEHIRNLTDQVRYPPQSGKFKIYIIDEVHMLSNAAFNAFLKTLEEPPPYAIFILATTEKHKVIPTILSRCQIFDFNRIGITEIVDHLKSIAEKEGIKTENEALHLIAQKSDGALRDALSFFDLINTFSSDNSISYQSTIQNLHVLDYDYYFKVTDHLLAQDISSSLLLFDEILQKGFEGNNFISGLELHFRNLMVCHDPLTHELLDESDNVKAKYLEQADRSSSSFLLSAMNICAQCDLQYKTSNNTRLLVELTLMKLAHIPSVLDLSNMKEPEDKKKVEPTEQVEKKKTDVTEKSKSGQPSEPDEVGSSTLEDSASEDSLKPDSKSEAELEKPEEHPTPTPKSSLESKEKQNGETNLIHSKLKKTGAIPSLKDIKNSVDESIDKTQSKIVEDEPKLTEKFTDSDLKNAWKDFKEKRSGRAQEQNVLSQPYALSEDKKVITIQLSNSVQLDILSEIRSDLMIHLKSILKNDTFQIEGTVAKDESKEMLYTNKEKFNHLAKKNPQIKSLQEKLGLDPEF